MKIRASFCRVLAVAAGIAVAGCGSPNGSMPGPAGQAPPRFATTSTPIAHVVLMVQENRTFNNLFGTFPNAVGTTTGIERVGTGKKEHDVSIALKETPLLVKNVDLNHQYPAYKTAYRNGHMDAFNRIRSSVTGHFEGKHPYEYVNPADIQEYWTLATDYGLADMMFQTQGSGSFTAHQDLIRGGTEITTAESLIDDPSSNRYWGCKAYTGTKTSLITTQLVYEHDQGPLPCTSDFPYSGSQYKTLADLFAAKSISWKYYAPPQKASSPGALWNAFQVIDSIYGNKSEWGAHISTPTNKIFKDIENGNLPQMSWVIPDGNNSDHPGYPADNGPSWVGSVVNAIGGSSYWSSTAIIVVWDDWGGFYDAVPPAKLDNQGGPGFRVGMLVISPYVPANEISDTPYGFGSIVKFVEDNWSLGSLGTTDKSSTSIANMFKFTMKPRAFRPIHTKYSRAFFIHQRPSGLPVDTE